MRGGWGHRCAHIAAAPIVRNDGKPRVQSLVAPARQRQGPLNVIGRCPPPMGSFAFESPRRLHAFGFAH